MNHTNIINCKKKKNVCLESLNKTPHKLNILLYEHNKLDIEKSKQRV